MVPTERKKESQEKNGRFGKRGEIPREREARKERVREGARAGDMDVDRRRAVFSGRKN